MFSGYCFYVFFFSSKFSYLFVIFFIYFTRNMKTITGRRHWVLTAESRRLTTMDDNNTLAVFAGYYTRSLFPLPAFLNDVHVADIHPGLIKLNEIKTPVLELFLTCIERDSLCYTSRRNIFNFYQLSKLSMSSSSMVKQVQILHQRNIFLFEVILGTLCLFLMTTGAVGVSYPFHWALCPMRTNIFYTLKK